MAAIHSDKELAINEGIKQIKNNIETNFGRIISIILEKKSSLLKQLEIMEEQINSKWTSYRDHLNKLYEHHTSTEIRFKSNEFEEILESQLAPILEQIENFKLYEPSHSINFTWNSEIENMINHIAHIACIQKDYIEKRGLLSPRAGSPTKKFASDKNDSLKMLNSTDQFEKFTREVSFSEINYKEKEKPSFSFGSKGTAQGQLNGIRAIAIDSSSDQLYVVDRENNRVQIFTLGGEFIKVFGQISSKCHKMNQPEAICLWQDLVYIGQKGSDCVQMFSNNGTLIKTAGFKGSEEGMFIHPWGMAAKEDGTMLLICDSGNHRIQVFDIYLNFKFAFGYSILRYPRDIKLYKKSVFVLDFGDYCVKEFDVNFGHLRSFIGRGSFAYLLTPTYMEIDYQGNLLLPCWERSQVYVYSQKDELLYIIQTSQPGLKTPVSYIGYLRGSTDYQHGFICKPTGICIDKENRVIIANYQNDKNCIHYF